MELKYDTSDKVNGFMLSFNRTFMELKYVSEVEGIAKA